MALSKATTSLNCSVKSLHAVSALMIATVASLAEVVNSSKGVSSLTTARFTSSVDFFSRTDAETSDSILILSIYCNLRAFSIKLVSVLILMST